jgi:putative acetyltransferase
VAVDIFLMPALAIRAERPENHAAIRRVHELAFRQVDEADLVEALRAAGDHVPRLCLVAVDGDDVVGHIFFSEARLDTGVPVLALAPMGVLPDRQRQGVGSVLMREGLRRAAATDFPLVVVVGHADYYPRFGFERGEDHGVACPFPVPAEAWMVHLLPAYRPEARGTVEYPEAFGL